MTRARPDRSDQGSPTGSPFSLGRMVAAWIRPRPRPLRPGSAREEAAMEGGMIWVTIIVGLLALAGAIVSVAFALRRRR